MSKNLLKPFYLMLRKLGFKRQYPNDRDVLMYIKIDEENDVKLDLQLWRDGTHRVSHWKRSTSIPNYQDGTPHFGVMETRPTDFRTIDGMLKAIEFEKTRDAKNIPMKEGRNFN